jgi:CRISPR-associated protein Cas2
LHLEELNRAPVIGKRNRLATHVVLAVASRRGILFVLIAYDVSTVDKAGEKRLRRVARACEDFGQRVQKSVFECRVEPLDWVTLRHRLLTEIDPKRDSLRFYFLDAGVRIEHYGAGEPTDFNRSLIF